MRILAVDTSTESCSAALLCGDDVRLRQEITERGHAGLILPMVDALLSEAELSLSRLDGIAFGRGPGSFTGLRIAAAVVQGLGVGSNLPVVGISSLAAVAQQVRARPGEGILVCNDARMGEVYHGTFARDDSGILRRLTADAVSEPMQLEVAIVLAHAAGNALERYAPLREQLLARSVVVHSGLYPRADAVARLAIGEFNSGRAAVARKALPVYIRDDVARRPSRLSPARNT